MKKSELRKIYISKQRDISASDRAEKSNALAENFFRRFEIAALGCLHCFIPIEKFNEIDTMAIIKTLWKNFPRLRVVVPRIDPETGAMRSAVYTAETELKKNVWDIPEPCENEYIDANEIDMVLLPLLCFDEAGHRVGYGKGFYDRFLKTCRADCVKVGLSYFELVSQIDDIHDGDVTLDYCITPDGLFNAETPRRN